ncbi:epithelial-stromal interaction protein 1 [Myripristis murdjan]|uniref:epithelial-stromal interaction protein 1 n=1 Tax=Myripristis murdjan TaxID=586833 RepID=UPI001176152B|nr:epithelial-stromal interaction protein 1 [Myripristis murdjan]
MDQYNNQRDTRRQLNYNNNTAKNNTGTLGQPGDVNPPENPDGNAPGSRDPGATPRESRPQHSDGFTMITPNESRRNKLKTMAQKEEEDLQRWREANKPPSVHLPPEKLGGSVSLAEARERQLIDLRQSKLQKKLKKEELDRRKRQEEEEELQKKKAIQREKAERLEERRRREEQQRREQFRQDHLRTTESFLQSLEPTRGPAAVASSSATHTSSWDDALEEKQMVKKEDRIREVQLDHRRVNSAFLDKLEGQSTTIKREEDGEESGEAQRHPSSAFEDFRHQLSQSGGPQDPLTHLKPDPDQSSSGWAEEADPEADFEWAVMKLESKFPYCSRAFLQDILAQCSEDYQQAYTLLSDSLH